MVFLNNWLDSGTAKRAAQDAFRSKYPKRDLGVSIALSSDPESVLVMVLSGTDAERCFWRVSRESFIAVEVPQPPDWPASPPDANDG